MKRLSNLFIILLILSTGAGVRAKENGRHAAASLNKTLGSPTWTRFNINYLSTSFNVDGRSDLNLTNPSYLPGLFYPKGGGIGPVCAAGPIWGAQGGVSGDIREGGIIWNYATLTPGRILDNLVPESAELPKNRVYRVRPDIPPGNRTADITSEVNDGEGSAESIYGQYQKDWMEWPWQEGAPFDDKDKNGVYDPAMDIPGVPGADQTIWGVAHDVPSTQFYDTRPLGVEIHTTVWGYKSEGALGHMLFRRYQFINRNSIPFDSMYVALWVDPDVGNPGDDLAGCDTTRSLGYAYNGEERDNVYSPLPPPAVGFDFFQGPVVQGSRTDSAIFKGKRVYGKRNLPMTAFFANTGGAIDIVLKDPFEANSDDVGTVWVYRALQGLLAMTGDPYVDPATGAPTKFPFAGDPEKRTGWLDGTHGLTFGDRRMGVSTGPFTMMPGDTQEVVLAEIVAGAIPGCDRLSAVGLLKFYDDQAQAAYNNFFAVPRAPAQPKVTASALDQEIILEWGSDSAAVAATEVPNPLGYAFEGYNIYQLPSASAAEGVRLATFDVINGVGKIMDNEFDPTQGTVLPKVKEFGTDSGIQRWFRILTDHFRNNSPLVNGNPCYLAVTAYNYNPAPGAVPAAMETPLGILTVVPHSPDPGTRLAGHYGDTIAPVILTTVPGLAPSDGMALPLVINPAQLTGHQYAVSFDTVAGAVTWKLTDMTTNQVKLSKQENQSGDYNYGAVDGIQIKVVGPQPGMRDWSIPSGTRRFSPSGGFTGLGLEGFSTGSDPFAYDEANGTIGMAGHFAFGGIGTTLTTADYHTVLLKLAAVDIVNLWDPKATPTDPNFSRAYRYLRASTAAPAQPSFVPWIVNVASGYAYEGYDWSVPFSAWDMDVNPPQRLAVGHFENNVTDGAVDGRYWPGIATVDNSVTREFVFIFKAPYTDTPDPALAVNLSNNKSTPLMWVMTCARRAEVAWMAGDQFRIDANHVNWPGNTFGFIAPKNVTGDQTLAKDDIGRINVFPNPYYGVNPQELNKYQRFVTFNHLPRKATIRIFNLAGVMVRRITRERDSQFEQWDLKNEGGLPVGSGLYIAHVDMPDLGVTKILKIAIVQEQQILDRY